MDAGSSPATSTTLHSRYLTNTGFLHRANSFLFGAVAQLGERFVRNEEAAGSIPASSTKIYPRTTTMCR